MNIKLGIIIVIVTVVIFGFSAKLGSDAVNYTDDTKEEEVIHKEYQKYDVNTLMKELNSNALNAKKKYKNQYVEITGELTNIDSGGDYIDVSNTDNEFYLFCVLCYINDDKQLDSLSRLSIGDKVTVKGQITDVSELIGYSLDVDSISKAK